MTERLRISVLSAALLVLSTMYSPSVWAEEILAGARPLQVTRISREACRQLALYQGDGSADYQPGVAADGHVVAPADVDGASHFTPQRILSFPVEIDPFEGRAAPRHDDSSMQVAEVTVDTVTGRISVDGEEIGGADKALAEACARRNWQK